MEDATSIDKISLSDLATAKAYYEELKSRQGDFVNMDLYMAGSKEVGGSSSKKAINRKYVIFEKGFKSQTKKSIVMEFPVVADHKFSTIFHKKGDSLDMETRKELFKASFDRLLIVKDKTTGIVSHRFVTYIPEIKYLRSKKNDISHNQLTKLDRDFSGYILYKNWSDDRSKYYIHYEKGKKRYQQLNGAKPK